MSPYSTSPVIVALPFTCHAWLVILVSDVMTLAENEPPPVDGAKVPNFVAKLVPPEQHMSKP